MTDVATELSTVGLSAAGHEILQSLERDGTFLRVLDGYRFAIALAIAHGGCERRNVARRTIFNVGTVDPDRTLYEIVSIVRDLDDEPVYRTLERFAEWGATELGKLRSGGEIDFGSLLKEAESMRQPS